MVSWLKRQKGEENVIFVQTFIISLPHIVGAVSQRCAWPTELGLMRVHTVSSYIAASPSPTNSPKSPPVQVSLVQPVVASGVKPGSAHRVESTDRVGDTCATVKARAPSSRQGSAFSTSVSSSSSSALSLPRHDGAARVSRASPLSSAPSATASSPSLSSSIALSTPSSDRISVIPAQRKKSAIASSALSASPGGTNDVILYTSRGTAGLSMRARWMRSMNVMSQAFAQPRVRVVVIVAFLTLALFLLNGNRWAGLHARSRVSWITARRSARRTLHDYQRLLHVYPLLSRAITAGIIFLFADTIAQLLNRPRQKPFSTTFSPARALRYSAYGLFLMGPFLYVWYDAMHRFGPPDDLHGALLKAVVESLVLEPICLIMYMVYDVVMLRRSLWYLKQNLRRRLFPIWFSNTLYWFPANFANYYVGTPDMRVIFSNTCSLFWNIYFSDKVSRWTVVRSSSSTAAVSPGSANNVDAKPLPV